MISRVAAACFWMNRQMERADAMARLLRVNRSFVLDAKISESRKWYPMLVTAGEHERFDELHEEHSSRADADLVQNYLTWEESNPVSIHSAVYWTRENARTIRDVISLETWAVINDLWHWLSGGKGRKLFRRDPDAFYRHVSDTAATYQGVCANTMLHEAPLDFMQLGTLLERAGQTARILDVHNLTFEQDQAGADAALAEIQWLALLGSCSATASFARRMRAAPTGTSVVGFLVLDERFPRSVLHCLDRAHKVLSRVASRPVDSAPSSIQLSAIRDSLRGLSAKKFAERGVHPELTRIVETTADICQALHDEYFDPVRPPAYTSGSDEVAPPQHE